MTSIGRRIIPDSSKHSSDEVAPRVVRKYTLRTVTPKFGGGVKSGQTDERMPVRASGIRGQLRFWWRMLLRDKFSSDGVLNIAALRAREAEIWGSTEHPSAVQARVDAKQLSASNYRQGELFGFKPFSPEAYALFSAIENKSINRIVKEGLLFSLQLSWPSIEELNRLRTKENQQRNRNGLPLLQPTIDDFTSEIEASVSTWMALGGVGARTRRGLGALELVESTHPLPAFALPPGARLFVPGVNASDAMEAWTQAVEAYQRFRQSFRGGKHRKNFGREKSGNVPGRSHWPEPDSIRQITGCALDDGSTATSGIPDDENTHKHTTPLVTQADPNFPRAVLGLPIGFHFAGDGPGKGAPARPTKDPATVELVPWATDGDGRLLEDRDGRGNPLPIAGDRMASPIITKPMLLDGKWHAAVVVLPHEHALRVSAVLKGKDARWDKAKSKAVDLLHPIPNTQIIGSHLSALCPATMSDPMRGHENAIEALVAFLGQPRDGAKPAESKRVFTERTPT